MNYQKPPARSRLLRMASACALILGGGLAAAPAHAQERGASDPDEIVVTARKREERLQDTPIAITAVSGAQLEERGAVDLTDVASLAPNVIIRTGGHTSGTSSAPVVSIRGIGQSDFTINTDPGVGIYVDGVYLGRTLGSVLDLVDVQRVEVLRGPQGTLFGRNTIGGAISIVSRAPSTDSLHGQVTLMAGENELAGVRGSMNIPLSSEAALRISAMYRERDGHVDALQYDDLRLGGEQVWGARVAMRIEPTAAIAFDISADYSQRRDPPAATVALDLGSLSLTNPGTTGNVATRFNSGVGPAATAVVPWISTTAPQCLSDPVFRDASLTCYGAAWLAGMSGNNSVWVDNRGNRVVPESSLNTFGASVAATVQAPIGEFRSITAFREFDSVFYNDLDYTPFVIFHNNHDIFEQEQISQEFQLVGDAFGGRLNYVVGAYYFNETGAELLSLLAPLEIPAGLAPTLAFGLPFFQTTARYIDNTSHAVFAQGTLYLTTRLAATLGARWTRDEKDYVVEQLRIAGPTARASGLQVSEEWTPMLNVAYDITSDIMAYATYSRGYRQGGFAARFEGGLPNPLPSYDPEFVNAYEAGLKTEWADGRLIFNAAVFRTEYSDIQVTATTPTLSGFTLNLSNAELTGVELEFRADVGAGFTIDGNIGYTHDEITEVAPGTTTYGGTNIVTPITTDNELPGPDWQVRMGVAHRLHLSGLGRIDSRLEYFYEGADYFSIANNAQTLRKSFSLLDATIAYTPESERFTFTLSARNLLDEQYFSNITMSSASGAVYGAVSRPREIFAQLVYRFGE